MLLRALCPTVLNLRKAELRLRKPKASKTVRKELQWEIQVVVLCCLEGKGWEGASFELLKVIKRLVKSPTVRKQGFMG